MIKKLISKVKPKEESQIIFTIKNNSYLYIGTYFYNDYIIGYNSVNYEETFDVQDIEWWIYTNEI